MDAQDLKAMIASANNWCGDELRVRAYSGRGMRGKECVSVAVPHSMQDLLADIADACINNSTQHVKHIPEMLRDARQDNLGKGVVVYWPGVAWEAEEVDEPEEEDEEV